MVRIKRCVEAAAPLNTTAASHGCTGESQLVTVPKQPPKRRRRGHSSSERGREFRARQRQYEAHVERTVARLRQEIQQHKFLLNVWEAKVFRERHSVFGPLVGIAREYYTLFRDGLHTRTSGMSAIDVDLIGKQESMLRSIVDSDVVTGVELRGPEVVIDQWRFHTAMFRQYTGEIIGMPSILGSEDHPVVLVNVDVKAVLGLSMVDILYPPQNRPRAAQLLSKYEGVIVRFLCRTLFQFNHENRISWQHVEIDYAQGLLDAGMPLEVVQELLSMSLMSPHSTIEIVSSSEIT